MSEHTIISLGILSNRLLHLLIFDMQDLLKFIYFNLGKFEEREVIWVPSDTVKFAKSKISK